MTRQNAIREGDRDRALNMLRWLTAVSGIGSLVIAALGTSAAARASTPSPAVRPSGTGLANPAPGSLSTEQLAALDFALPPPTTVVIWQTPGRAATAGRAGTWLPPPGAPAATSAPRPAPTPPPPPVATTGTS